jgi:hypothetical protein
MESAQIILLRSGLEIIMKPRGEEKKLIIVIGKLQTLISNARNNHYNDRDPNSFERGQAELNEAFELCIETTGRYDRVEE